MFLNEFLPQVPRVMKRILLFLIFLLAYLPKNFATHIVGGTIGYECLGVNQANNTVSLRITLEVYRDAFNGQAPFDNPAAVGIFSGASPYNLVQTISMSNPQITNAPVDLGTPCGNLGVNTGNVIVERGIYTQTVTLPLNTSGYWISYQRCCRNGTINNLINPGAVGATYTMYISAYALQNCNNSPTFDNYPPVAICKDFPLTFDHAATDLDGDSLVYSFCHPYAGASSMAPAPNPPAAPPYNNIPFSGGFSPGFPMPGAPGLSIDPQTGVLTGVPAAVGQYVVGVCVTEYDTNGVLLSTTLRDFQFNVFECENSVEAGIQSDLIDPLNPDLGYLIGVCDNNTITFINQSSVVPPSPPSIITGYEWNFDLNNGNNAVSNATNPTITFPGPDVYTGFLVVNPGDPYCTDTALISLEIYPPMNPAVAVAIDSCNPALPPIQFTDQSTIGGTASIVGWDWDFGDGTSSTLQNPSHNYPNAGSYIVDLVLTDDNGCQDSTTLPVDWYPPAVPQFTVDVPSGCEPHTATFTHTSFPFLPSYTTTWDFGDGDSSFASPTVTHVYPDPGTYDVSLTHVSPWGCVSNLTIPDMITVFEGPNADYTYTYDSCEYEAVDFFDASTPNSNGDPIVNWLWDFKDGTTATGPTSSHLYQLAGTYPVDLVVTDVNGCTDTIADFIDWYPKPVIDVTIASPFGCAPYSVFFDNQSYPINGYSTIWDFGDGNTDTVASPTHVYQNPGIYYVNLVITSPLGCTDTFRDTVEVWETPNADFSFSLIPV
jgi:PKD repeat protein